MNSSFLLPVLIYCGNNTQFMTFLELEQASESPGKHFKKIAGPYPQSI